VAMKRSNWLIVLFLSFILILFSIIGIYFLEDDGTLKNKQIVSNDYNIDNMAEKLSINKVRELQDYYNNLDIQGVISIDGLDYFEYPVVKTSNNSYYLNHNYNGEYDVYGSIYADYRSDLDNGKKVLIYGHSSSKVNVPFNVLENYEDKAYFEKNRFITLETEINTYRYEIFSVYVETNDFSYMNMNFDNKGDWYAHIIRLKNKSMHFSDVSLGMDENILILQTCSKNSDYQNYSKKYLLIVSRRVK